MDLTFNDHRVDLNTTVVNCDVLAQLHLAGFGVNLHGGQVRAMRVREVHRVDSCFT